MAASSAHCLAVVLMDRLASMAARASAPTRSTPGSPCRKLRSEACDQAAVCVSAGALIGDSLRWDHRPSFSPTVTTTIDAQGGAPDAQGGAPDAQGGAAGLSRGRQARPR